MFQYVFRVMKFDETGETKRIGVAKLKNPSNYQLRSMLNRKIEGTAPFLNKLAIER